MEETSDMLKISNICIIIVQENKKRDDRKPAVSEILAKNFPKPLKGIDSQI